MYIDIFEEYDSILGLTENLNFEVGTEEEEQVYIPVFEEDEEGNIKVFKNLELLLKLFKTLLNFFKDEDLDDGNEVIPSAQEYSNVSPNENEKTGDLQSMDAIN